MSLARRIIPCLDTDGSRVVKGVHFEGLRDAGDPGALARRYNVEGIDEVVILDVTATIESRQARANTIAAVERDNVSAVQFHPEKSGDVGLKILSNWLTNVI